MKFARLILSRIHSKAYLLRVRIMTHIFGLEYVTKEIAQCLHQFVPVLLKQYGATVGNSANFKNNIHIDNATGDRDSRGDFSNIRVGDRCYIGKNVFFDLPNMIIIQDECVISAGVKFITHRDCGKRVMSRYYPRESGKIVIGYGSWIGVNAVILHGVRLGNCCVVAAGSVVTNGFPDYSVIAGAPARLVKTLNSEKDTSL